jgi:hypothetical protein
VDPASSRPADLFSIGRDIRLPEVEHPVEVGPRGEERDPSDVPKPTHHFGICLAVARLSSIRRRPDAGTSLANISSCSRRIERALFISWATAAARLATDRTVSRSRRAASTIATIACLDF